MTKKILEFPELRDEGVLLSRRQIDRLEAANKFPKRVPTGENRVGWVTEEIRTHVANQIASRSTAPGTLGSATPTAKVPRTSTRQAERA